MKLNYLFVFLIITNLSMAHAAENVYIREYSYKAGELDSKVSARKNALDQAKALLLEEIATYVYSSNNMTQSLDVNYQKRFVQNVKNISAGFVGAKILEEKWDGNIFWLRAEIHADPAKIQEELKASLNSPDHNDGSMSIAMQPEAASPVNRSYVQKANMANALVLVNPIKMSMLEYYQYSGSWPSSFEQLGLKESEMSDGDLIDRVVLGKDGEVKVMLGKKFGVKKYYKINPEFIMGGMNMKWICVTNMPRNEVPQGMSCEVAP